MTPDTIRLTVLFPTGDVYARTGTQREINHWITSISEWLQWPTCQMRVILRVDALT